MAAPDVRLGPVALEGLSDDIVTGSRFAGECMMQAPSGRQAPCGIEFEVLKASGDSFLGLLLAVDSPQARLAFPELFGPGATGAFMGHICAAGPCQPSCATVVHVGAVRRQDDWCELARAR